MMMMMMTILRCLEPFSGSTYCCCWWVEEWDGEQESYELGDHLTKAQLSGRMGSGNKWPRCFFLKYRPCQETQSVCTFCEGCFFLLWYLFLGLRLQQFFPDTFEAIDMITGGFLKIEFKELTSMKCLDEHCLERIVMDCPWLPTVALNWLQLTMTKVSWLKGFKARVTRNWRSSRQCKAKLCWSRTGCANTPEISQAIHTTHYYMIQYSMYGLDGIMASDLFGNIESNWPGR